MALIDVETERLSNPVDLVETLVSGRSLAFERSAEDEISVNVEGEHTDYHVSFSWVDDVEALHIACGFDFKVSERRHGEVLKLLASINEEMWLGHFDLWSREGVIMFRHTLLLAGGAEASLGQCEVMLDAALAACDRYYQAFQFVLWGGKSAREALDAVLFETAGEA